MKLAVNGRFLSQHSTGVQRVAYNFTKELATYFDESLTVYSPRDIIQEQWCRSLPVQYIDSQKPESLFWEQIALPKKVKKHKEFLLNFGNVAPIYCQNQAVMIHDVSVFHNASWFSWAFALWYKFVLPIVAKKSKFVMTVSEFSKKEIHHYLQIPLDKIFVLPLWLNQDFINAQESGEQTKDPYVLTVSSLDPRKNYTTLLRSFIRMNQDSCSLYAVGSTAQVFAKDPELLNYANHSQISFLGRCSDKELIDLYKKATCYCNISYYEGFGLTALEAMACSCPLILSDIPAHREVCGNAAIYVDPNDEDEVQKKLHDLLTDKKLQQELIEKGRERVKLFTKEASIQKLLDKLQSLEVE